MYWRILCRILTSIERNTIAIESQSFMSRIRPRLIRCHWSFDPRWVKISGHSDHVGLLRTLSTIDNQKVKTRGASCIGGFGQTDGWRKFKLGIPQSRGAFILEVRLILETRRYMFVIVNFNALAQASDFLIQRRHVVFLCWMQDSNPGSQTPNRQQTECPLTNRLSYQGSSKNLNSTARP